MRAPRVGHRGSSVTPAQGRIGVVDATSRKPRRRERVQGGGSERPGRDGEHPAPRAQPNARGPSGREQHPEHRHSGRRHGNEVPVEVDYPVNHVGEERNHKRRRREPVLPLQPAQRLDERPGPG